MTARAAQLAKDLGVERSLEELRGELELAPRLGVLLGPRRHDGIEVRKTRIEANGEALGLAVAYVYTPAPPPPPVAITSVTPDDGIVG
ncbi:hypothetical protein ACFUXJ_23795 [Streptomyces olivaceus]|uniref:hypothetical protein n=1 Tax=Streptomyces olivaceus TaxID=47716 RepID=UPI00362CA0FF